MCAFVQHGSSSAVLVSQFVKVPFTILSCNDFFNTRTPPTCSDPNVSN